MKNADFSVERLSPVMTSRRGQVLRFVRQYLAHYGISPSYGEIAQALSTNKTRVKDAIHALVRDGLLLRSPGQRGLTMPTEAAAAIRTLRALGYVVDADIEPEPRVTLSTLPRVPVLGHPRCADGGGIDDGGSETAQRGERAGAGA